MATKKPPKPPPQVHLVYQRGEVMTVFHDPETAKWFADQLDEGVVVPRTLFYGQPNHRGYNK